MVPGAWSAWSGRLPVFLDWEGLRVRNRIWRRATQSHGAFRQGFWCWGKCGRQIGNRRVGSREIKCAAEVAHDRAPPRAQVGDLGTESRFEESQHRCVIESMGRYQPAAAERRNDQQWNPETQSNRPANRWITEDVRV